MINRVVLVGRLSRDPELKPNDKGTTVCKFTVAVDNRTKDAEGNKTASFINCVAFGNAADNTVKFLKTGNLVGVEGRLNVRNFVRPDGSKGTATEVLCDSVQFLEPKNASKKNDSNEPTYTDITPETENAEGDTIDTTDNDLPF